MNPQQLENALKAAAKELGNSRTVIQKAVLIVQGHAMRNAPVRTGTLRRSITSQVDSPLTGRVGTNLEYAPYVESGTRYMAAQPYLEPAIEQSRDEVERALLDFGEGVLRKVGR